MSKFLRAFELAEQEQALPRHPGSSGPVSERGPAVPEAIPEPAPSRAPQPSVELPRGVSDRLEEHLVSLLAPTSFEAEQYRVLRHLIEQLHKSAGLSVIAVSSPSAADGKTTTAINLAGALAQAPDSRVLLVDVDLRGAVLAARLGFDDRGGPGLVEAILDADLPLEAAVRLRPPLNVSVLPAGSLPSAPYEVLKSPRVGELLAEARRRYDYIILDTPPLVSFPDCRVIEKWVDGLLIVVTAHRTARKLVEEALHITDSTKVVGLVFNGDDHHLSRESYPLGRYADRYADRNGNGSKDRMLWSRWRARRRQTASDE